MVKTTKSYLVMLSLLVVSSCSSSNSPDKIPIARVGDHVLMLSDIQNVLPDGITREDSLLLADDFVHRWITNELLIRKAQENLSINQKEMEREMAEYRNSLLIYRYQTELMEEKMDTLISEEEIAAFHDANPDDFILVTDLVKAVFLQVPLAQPKWRQALPVCQRSSERDFQEISAYCEKYAGKYNLYIDRWIEVPTLLKSIENLTPDKPGITGNRSRWESRDRENYYLLYVLAFRGKGTVAPLEYVSGNIKTIIINKRKSQFIKQVENSIYTEGLRNNKFKIYAYEKN